jgi:hypothetical protein
MQHAALDDPWVPALSVANPIAAQSGVAKAGMTAFLKL